MKTSCSVTVISAVVAYVYRCTTRVANILVVANIIYRRTVNVGALIINFESHEDLAECVASLQVGSICKQILVVDNSMSKSGREAAELLCESMGISLLQSGENLGFARGCNLGVQQFGPEIEQILFVNPDARVNDETVERLSNHLNTNPEVAAVNPTIYLPSSAVWFASGSLNRRLARLVQRPAATGQSTDWVNGCVLLVRREAFSAVGGFDERYFLYWEDVVLSLRLREAGWEIEVLPEVSATHIRGRDGGSTEAISPTQLEHSIRSRLIFARSELTVQEKLFAIPYSVLNVARLVQRTLLGGASTSEALRSAASGVIGGLS